MGGLKLLGRRGWNRLRSLGRRYGRRSVAAEDLRRQRRLIANSELFDQQWYLRQYGSRLTPAEAADPALHYLRVGEPLGWCPGSVFEPSWYARQRKGDAAPASHLVHYIVKGQFEGLSPGPSFDPSFYTEAYPDVVAAGFDPIDHYLKFGLLEGRLGRADQAPIKPGAWFTPFESVEVGSLAEADRMRDPTHEAWHTFRDECAGRDPASLHLLHAGGGGTERRIRDIIATQFAQRNLVLFTQRQGAGWRVMLLENDSGQWRAFTIGVEDIESFRELLRALNLETLHIHQPKEILPALGALLAGTAIRFEITVNDFSLLCPRDSFVDVRGNYCGEPDAAGCNACLKEQPRTSSDAIETWRREGLKALRRAEIVHCPSADTAARVQRYCPDAKTIVAAPPEAGDVGETVARVPGKELKVAVLGALSQHKGAAFLLDCVEAAVRSHHKVRWSVVGYFSGASVADARRLRRALDVSGAYRPEDATRLVAESGADVIFFPQHCVETYSYALSEALRTGLPIMGPAIGPFPERLAGLRHCAIYPVSETAAEVVARIVALAKAQGICAGGS